MSGKKLNILQVTNRIPWPLNDGGNIATWKVGSGLKALGHSVTLASLNTKKHRVNVSSVPGYSAIFSTELDTSPSLLSAILHFFSYPPYNISRFRSDDFEHLLEKLTQENHFDVVQLEGIYLAIFLPALRRHYKGPVVLRAHNIEHRVWRRMAAAEGNPIRSAYFSRLAAGIEAFEKDECKAFQAIIPITQEDANWFASTDYRGIIKTIPGGAEIVETPVAHSARKKNAICFIGSLEWMPNVEGLDWFIEQVWPKVREKNPDAEFHLAGKNPPEKYATQNIPGFHFYGEVADSGNFLDKFHTMIIPLRSGSGMRMKAVEAMGRGLSVISTTIGVEGIPGTKGIHFRIADSADDLAAEISKALSHPENIEKTALAGYHFVKENYNWEKLVKDFEEIYFALK